MKASPFARRDFLRALSLGTAGLGQVPLLFADERAAAGPTTGDAQAARPDNMSAADAADLAAARARGYACLRSIAELLGLPYLCRHAACRRSLHCKGKPENCIPRHTPQVPEAPRAWVRGLLLNAEMEVDFDEALENVAEHQEGFALWHAGLKAKHP